MHNVYIFFAMKQTVEDIIKKCGGDMAVAFRIGRHQVTIYKWREMGIPAKCWRGVIDLYRETCGGRLTPEDILSANELAANERMKRSA